MRRGKEKGGNMRNEEELDDDKVHLILKWAVNTRNAETRKGAGRDYNKNTLACRLQDACLEYVNRWGNEQEIIRLQQEIKAKQEEIDRLRNLA